MKEKLIKKIGSIILSAICVLSCNTKGVSSVDDVVNSFNISDAKVYTERQLFEQFILSNDSVFLRSDKSPFSGKIQILGDLEYTKSDGEFTKKETTLALFNLQKGAFVGEQLYSMKNNKVTCFIYSPIIPCLDMKEDIDFMKVNEGEPSDWSISGFGFTKYYKIVNPKSYDPFNVAIFWPNGNLLFKTKFKFNDMLYAWATSSPSSYDKHLTADKKETINLFHYNGKLAYKGISNKGNVSRSGDFFDFNGNKTDSVGFAMPCGTNLRQVSADKIDFNLDDKYYKCFRKFFR
jgi:hypothetical protein